MVPDRHVLLPHVYDSLLDSLDALQSYWNSERMDSSVAHVLLANCTAMIEHVLQYMHDNIRDDR